MKGPLLLLFVLLALMATFARAEAPQEESLVEKVQVYAQQAAQKVQEHLATIRESQPAQQAREWLEASFSHIQQYLSQVKDKLTSVVEKTTVSSSA
ncbi:apolipoprotein C-III [Sceloporus undulatus]|uniref:apolipoprotein C-III n=1 Tax=Sceloporus undulatus TaxID=8520 RepID=UPI001C4D6549|nr:apolipoprotein C-III [Sceloporus undulatus]